MTTIENQVKENIDNLFIETGYDTLMKMILKDPHDAIGIFVHARKIEEKEVKLRNSYASIIVQDVINYSTQS